MKTDERPETTLGARLGKRLAVAIALTAMAGGYIYWQKQKDAPATLSATEQTIHEQLNQTDPQIGQSASVVLAFSPVAAEGASTATTEADPTSGELQALLGGINRLLHDATFARETLDALGDTQSVGGARALDSQNLWVIKGEPYQIAAEKLSNSLTATGSSDSNLIKLNLVSDRPSQLKEVLDLHSKRLVMKWKTNGEVARTTLSNLRAEKEGLELEATNAVSQEKFALTQSLQNTSIPVDIGALKNQKQTLIQKIKALEYEVQASQPSKSSTAYSTHSHRVLIARLQDQQAYLQSQSSLADGNTAMKASIDEELRKLSAQLVQLLEQEKQTQNQAEDLADKQKINSDSRRLKTLRVELAALDQKIKAAETEQAKGNLAGLKGRTETLMKKLEVVEGQIQTVSQKPELRFGLELYN